ncbi:MAG: hypothetical protein Ct9H300mP3_12100 [Gammaproteobacteria bacterium]|nr:MAG: hypothetical protein Ct9H300mP3_12100 [Gammaproteobacteria bacterium]
MNQDAVFKLAEEAIKIGIRGKSINLHLQSENTVFKVEGLDGNTYALGFTEKGTMI